MIRYTKFIHIFAVSILALTFMSSFSASHREGTAIHCESVYDGYHVVAYDTVKLKNIIGENFYDIYDTKVILGEKIPNRDKLMGLFPSCSSHDTVTVVSTRYYPVRKNHHIPYKHSSVVKFNNELFYIRYYDDGEYKKQSIAQSGIYDPIPCAPYNTDMIMLNVLFEWDRDIVMCMMKSSPVPTQEFSPFTDNLAQRFILKDGVITDYQEIKFDDAFYWFLSGCYSRDSIPKKYLRDLRYDSPDSLITQYLQGVCYEETYWKRYTQ